jgi:hypothetical protein
LALQRIAVAVPPADWLNGVLRAYHDLYRQALSGLGLARSTCRCRCSCSRRRAARRPAGRAAGLQAPGQAALRPAILGGTGAPTTVYGNLDPACAPAQSKRAPRQVRHQRNLFANKQWRPTPPPPMLAP